MDEDMCHTPEYLAKTPQYDWQTLQNAIDSDIVVYDAHAATGIFTTRLVALASTVMRRRGGGKLIEIYVGGGSKNYLDNDFVNKGNIQQYQLDIQYVDYLRHRSIGLCNKYKDDIGIREEKIEWAVGFGKDLVDNSVILMKF